MRNRIKELRISKDLSLQGLADLVGTSNQQIYNLEAGKRKLSQNWMTRIANALHVEINDLLEEKSLPMVEVVGYATSDMKIERRQTGEFETIETVDAPYTYANIPRHEIKAIPLKEDVQQPMLIRGAILYFHEKNNIEGCLGKLCVILDKQNELHIKQLWQGGTAGTYSLTNLNNGSPLMNIEIQAAYKIICLEAK